MPSQQKWENLDRDSWKQLNTEEKRSLFAKRRSLDAPSERYERDVLRLQNSIARYSKNDLTPIKLNHCLFDMMSFLIKSAINPAIDDSIRYAASCNAAAIARALSVRPNLKDNQRAALWGICDNMSKATKPAYQDAIASLSTLRI